MISSPELKSIIFMRQNWNTCIVGNLFEQNTIQINLNTNIEEFWMWNVCDTQIIWKSWLKMVGLKFMDGNEIHICVTCDFPHVAERRLFQSFIFLCLRVLYLYVCYFHICALNLSFIIFICVRLKFTFVWSKNMHALVLGVSYLFVWKFHTGCFC